MTPVHTPSAPAPLMSRWAALAAALALTAAIVPAVHHVARATAPSDVVEYPIPTAAANSQSITRGPDGNLWFAEYDANQIGRITTSGDVTEYPLPTPGSGPQSITAGPDGNLWFTEYAAGKIGRISPVDGTVTEFDPPTSGSGPYDITAGPGDGNVWFSEYGAVKVGVITPTGAVTEYPVDGAGCGSPVGITAGPDGQIWFTFYGCGRFGQKVAQLSTSGVIGTSVDVQPGADPVHIVPGPDGALWFTESSAGAIGRVSTAGALTEYPIPTPSSNPVHIAAGGDGNLWFTEYLTDQIGRITPAGVVDEFTVPTSGAHPYSIDAADAPDGRLWFTEAGGNQIGVIATSATPIPAVHRLSPDRGPSDTGTTVVITGASLSGATAVDFGSVPAASFSVDSDTQVTAVSPALPGGYFDVTVTTPSGTTHVHPGSRWTSIAPLRITAISPAEGDPDGGTSVTVTGSGFTTATAVSFGGVPAADYGINADTQITAYSPPQPDHTSVHIVVSTSGASSATGPDDLFTYLARPVLDRLSPQSGPSAGGTPMVLTGSRFTGATSVSFGDAAVSCPAACQVVSDNEIDVVTPAHAVAGVPVTVTTAGDGTSLAGPMFAFTGAGAFAPTGSCAPSCASAGAVLLPSGKVLGVSRDGGVRANLYDPTTGRWAPSATCEGCSTSAGSLTMLGSGPPAACGANCGKALLVAGASAYLYDPGSDSWVPAASPPVNAYLSPAVLLADGRVLVAAGTAGAVYDPAADAWTSTGPLSHNHRSHTATLLGDGTVLVTGGGGSGAPSRPPRVDAAELYHPDTNSWTDTEPLAQGRLAHSAVRMADGKVLVTGGTLSFYVATRSAEIYDPATGHWQPAPDTIFARNSQDSTLLPDGTVLLSGGDEPFVDCVCDQGGGNNPSIGEVLDPTASTWAPTGPSLNLQDRGQNNQQNVARAVLLPSGPVSTCATRCGQVLVTRGRDSGQLAIPLTPSSVLYAPAPRATLAGPPTGPPGGGTAVTITGTGLASVSAVSFGGVAATSVTPDPADPDGRLVAVTPAHTVGPVDVAVTTAGGVAIADGRFSFQVPVVTPPAPSPTTTTTTEHAPVPGEQGYALVAADGGVFTFGAAPFLGSTGALRLAQPVVGIEPTPTGRGYWLVGADGGVFAFGAARFLGSTGGLRLARPIVGMRATPTGNGYWLVAADGGVFAFGDAVFRGSTGAMRLNSPIVGMERTATGNGYWLVASDGGIFAFGDAVFRGSTGAVRLNSPIVGMARSVGGEGYWLAASDGGVFAFGAAVFHGSAGSLRLNSPIVGAAPTTDGTGYWLCARDGGVFAFGAARFQGSMGAARLNQPVVGCDAPR